MKNGWKFIDGAGSFALENPQNSSDLYFPLANEGGLMAAISPTLTGDSKTGQNSFLLQPVSAEDLNALKAGRNFWVYAEGFGAWSAAGASAAQQAAQFGPGGDAARLEAGFLWHKLTRENAALGLRAEVTSLVPVGGDALELMRVRLTNIGPQPVTYTATAAIPVYGRSADNVRDHRHVTGLLGRARVLADGVDVCPAMTFDERGHKPNALRYVVLAAEGDGKLPVGVFADREDFVGEGGSLEWPEAVVGNRAPMSKPGDRVDGFETVGAPRFAAKTLQPGHSAEYIVAMTVAADDAAVERARGALSSAAFQRHFEDTEAFWAAKLGKTAFHSGDADFDRWMRWVTLQPVLRRIYGCSFLPHHDYGKGGRGWRDLWQDCLALLVLEPETARDQLWNNFGGVRMDGTNATIIGSKPGEFIADRNNISRVWSDHGAWPLFTTLLYVDNTGDTGFLFEKQTYFKDRLTMRSREVDERWAPEQGNRVRTAAGDVYEGTVLEHLLLQNATAFFNVGDHGNIRLENADWNDALDMAWDKGETVAFTSFYAGNLLSLAALLRELRARGVATVEVAAEMAQLFDTLGEAVDYACPAAKRARLAAYYAQTRHALSGERAALDTAALADDLEKKGRQLSEHIRSHEWLTVGDSGWFNGYYDNAGLPLEGPRTDHTRMTLTGQVFALMMGVASEEQVTQAAASVRQNLRDPQLGGYRLNTDFHEVKLDMGRCFGFAYGHKENGAVFSHMAVMYASALYRRGRAADGWDVLGSLYALSTDFERARIYPGIPEYFNPKGRGLYHYLTGSASWYLLVLLGDVYGVRGRMGDLTLQPALLASQFDCDGCAAADAMFAGRALRVEYRNPQRLEAGQYAVGAVTLDGAPLAVDAGDVVIPCAALTALDTAERHTLSIELIPKNV